MEVAPRQIADAEGLFLGLSVGAAIHVRFTDHARVSTTRVISGAGAEAYRRAPVAVPWLM